MLQNATHLRKSAPWPPNISDEHVSCIAPVTQNASFQIPFKCPTPAIVFGNTTKLSRFARCRILCWCVLYILTSKCPSCHNGVHFFNISTSKSGLRMVCFVHFDLEICLAPQRRALFRHHNFQKWSDTEVLCTFWLRNLLRATTACNFASLIWPAGSAPAALASLLFDPPEPQIIGKTVDRNFSTFSRVWIFLLRFYLFWSSLFFFSSLSVPTCAFPSIHIVGSLTSKLPSVIPVVPHKAVAEVSKIGNL